MFDLRISEQRFKSSFFFTNDVSSAALPFSVIFVKLENGRVGGEIIINQTAAMHGESIKTDSSLIFSTIEREGEREMD